jgi:hypothetical protein
MLRDHSCSSGNVFCLYAVLNETVSECESWDSDSGVADDEPLETVRPIFRTGTPLPSKHTTLYIFLNKYPYWNF